MERICVSYGLPMTGYADPLTFPFPPWLESTTLGPTRAAPNPGVAASKDVTADQFDLSVPQLWYPADPARYDRSASRWRLSPAGTNKRGLGWPRSH